MDFGRISELALRVQHRHSDGTWGAMDPSPNHHDPAAHDPEREWGTGTTYLCKACGEEVLITTADDPTDPRS
jgi:hypothetical protein